MVFLMDALVRKKIKINNADATCISFKKNNLVGGGFFSLYSFLCMLLFTIFFPTILTMSCLYK